MTHFNWSRPRHSAGVLATTAALLVGAGGLAYAQIPSASDATISACFKKVDGTLRVIDMENGQTCSAKEQLLQWNQQGLKGDTGATGPQGEQGPPGASAYDVAVAGGYEGTREQWLASLVGPKGDTGAQGPQGEQGPKGDQGDKGDTGASAYDSWLAEGNTGSVTEFLDSLSVQWSNVLHVPLDITNRVAADVECSAACVAGTEVAAGAITGQGTDTSGTAVGNLALNTVGADNLAGGSVVFGKIAPGAVQGLGGSALPPPSVGNIALGTITGEGAAGSAGTPTGNIALKSITNANIANATIRGGLDVGLFSTPNEIADGTVTSYDLGMNAVTADKLATGAVTTGKISDGAVTPDKQTANAQMATIDTPVSSGTPSSLGSASLAVGTGSHLVMLTSQGTFACTLGCSGSNPVTVHWQLVDGTTGVGPVYTQTLSDTTAIVPWTASGIATSGGSSAHTYTVKVTTGSTSPTTVSVIGTLNAVDLGTS